MVEDQVLDRAFGALADPTRRALLLALRDGDARITDLARPLPMTFAGVSRHVGVLEAAGLVAARCGAESIGCRSIPMPFARRRNG